MVTGLIAKYCVGLPALFVAALIHMESGGNPLASNDGNYGMMQIRLNTAKQMQCEVLNPTLCEAGKETCNVTKPAQLLDADTNVQCGCNYLKYQVKRYGLKQKDLAAAYNLGSVFKNEDGSYQNQQYVNDVMHAKAKLKKAAKATK